MSKSPQYNQQTEPKQSEVEEICIYQNLESGCHSIGSQLPISSENKCQKESQGTMSESSHVQWCFHSAKSTFMFTTMQPRYITEQTIRVVRESFNIRQKLGLFVLGFTHILNLPTVCIKVTRVCGWVQHFDFKI